MPDKFHKVEVAVTSPAGDDLFWGRRTHPSVPAYYLNNDSSFFYKDIFKVASKSRLEAGGGVEQEGAGMAQIIDVMDGLSQELVIYMLFCEQCLFFCN